MTTTGKQEHNYETNRTQTALETPAFGINLSITVASLASFIVWKVEQIAPFPQDESN